MGILERFRKRTDTDTDTDKISVSVHVSHMLDIVSQTIGMFHLSAFACVFLTNMTDRDTIHCIFSSFCLQMTSNFLHNIKHDTSESNSVGNVFDLGQKYN